MKRARPLTLLLASGVFALAGCGPTSDSSSESSSTDTTASSSSSDTTPDPSPNLIKDETSGDLNIYLYTEESAENRNSVWMWVDGGTSHGYVGSERGKEAVEGIDSDFKFISVHIKFNKDYETYSDWDFSAKSTLNLSGIDDAEIPEGIIFRSSDGTNQTSDIALDKTQMVATSGVYNVYVHEEKGVFYSPDDFPTAPIQEGFYREDALDGNSQAGPKVVAQGVDLDEIFTSFGKDRAYLRPYTYSENGEKVYGEDIAFDAASSSVTETQVVLGLGENLDITKLYEFMVYSPSDASVISNGDLNFCRFYSDDTYDAKYSSDLELGVSFSEGVGTARLYSPRASAISINIYGEDHTNLPESPTQHEMSKDANGVWSYSGADLKDGTYYTFDINLFGRTDSDVPDPYAYSSNANAQYSMAVDFDKVEELYSGPLSPEYLAPEITIMEMHVRDFTAHSSWNGTHKGKFLGLIEEGTSYQNHATGFDYVKELHEKGLTHIQILPSYDFNSVDETRLDDQEYQDAPYGGIYNWGYDPAQYNAPEGSYSTDPTDGTKRVSEFAQFVAGYREAGIGVVLDVVYNHMPSQAGTAFDRVFPDYYFRSVNYSGAGSDIASEHGMVRKFIVDSVVHYAEHYGINGFRFDLMGLLDLETMEEVRIALNEIDPNIIVYGEGWSMFSGDPMSDINETDMASQRYLANMGENFVGAFNDSYRDGVKGSVFDAAGKGYVQKALEGASGSTISKGEIYFGLSGTTRVGTVGYSYSNDERALFSSIAYVECHDNMTLYDKMMVSLDDPSADIGVALSMSNSSVLSSLSPAFFQLGQSFGRSKSFTDEKYKVEGKWVEDPNNEGVYYSTDSYNLSDAVNAIDWGLLETHADWESDFREHLNNRRTRALLLDSEFGRTDMKDSEVMVWDYGLESGTSQRNVVSFKINYKGSEILHVQNYGSTPVTIDGHVIEAEGIYYSQSSGN